MAKFARRSKYGNVRTNGFASKKEAMRAQELQLLEKAGEIRDLRFQVRYPLMVQGYLVAAYVADFTYVEADRLGVLTQIVEDAKGARTREYVLKRKLMRACHDVEIRET